MSTFPMTKRSVALVVTWVGIFLAIPLWREFHEPSRPLWNAFLALFLIALVVCAFFGVRYFQRDNVEVGESRFTASETDQL